MNENVDGFDDSVVYHVPRLTQFLTKADLKWIVDNPTHRLKFFNNIKKIYTIKSKTTFHEVEPYLNFGKIFIYLKRKGNKYVQSEKFRASHVLEQVFDNQGNVVSEEIKPFTYNGK